jgi:hypothetical protein
MLLFVISFLVKESLAKLVGLFLLSKIDEPTSYLKLTFKVNSLVVTIFDRGYSPPRLIMLSFFIICVTMLVFSSANLALIG